MDTALKATAERPPHYQPIHANVDARRPTRAHHRSGMERRRREGSEAGKKAGRGDSRRSRHRRAPPPKQHGRSPDRLHQPRNDANDAGDTGRPPSVRDQARDDPCEKSPFRRGRDRRAERYACGTTGDRGNGWSRTPDRAAPALQRMTPPSKVGRSPEKPEEARRRSQ